MGALLASLLLLSMGLLTASSAAADEYPAGYPRTGEPAEGINGYSLTNPGGFSVITRLHPVYFDDTDSPELAYCVEFTVGARSGAPLDVIDWETFPGNNNFRANAGKVTWVVYNSYPETPLASFAAQAGIDGLTEREAIAGTQAAIWTLTERDEDYRYLGLAGDVEAGVEERVGAVVDYLTGPANTGLPETQRPSVSIEPGTQTGQAGELVGPMTITASADTVTLTSTSDYTLMTSDGDPVDLDAVPTGAQLFLDVPADAPAGEATFTASLDGPVSTGVLVTPQERGQTIMVATTNEATATAQGTLSWAAVPRISTHAADAADGDDFLAEHGPVTVVDTVTYDGLLPGTEYELRGELMQHDGGAGTATGITASTVFTPETAGGTVELTFDVPAEPLRGAQIVVFESLYADGTVVAVHADIDDAAQTVYRPAIETDAYDKADADQHLAAGGAVVSDDVTYSGLRAGETYVLRGELMDQVTGESTGIVGETRFTPASTHGVETLDLEVPEGYAGRTLVVFERLYLDREGMDERLVATHEDLEDTRQTVVVDDGGELPAEEVPTPSVTVTPAPAPTGTPEAPTTLPDTGVGGVALALGGALALLALGAGLLARRTRLAGR
ncbi:VaFE repeat-containing surface-anchored protein [Georgenia wangjunii]|uniref:VaFE repeat-containing surface-anchored protein n=1 Tax=Georgenia wangjunii TaxID=3117730 RepID=UPI002F260DF1